MDNPRVLLCVTGGIAAYKACEVLRGLQKAGCDVRVAMTESARRFVGEVTFEALSGAPVAFDLFGHAETAIPHIQLSGWADVALVCPCTANVMAKVAHGIADDCVSATLLACDVPVLVAPAMNTRMWENPATQDNRATLEARGVSLVLPAEGRLACGDVGTGKLASVDEIVDATLGELWAARNGRPLAGRSVVITAGPTHEAIDPVRFIANASSGKMGYALARAARDAGASVTLVSGPVALAAPHDVEVVRVTSAAQMLEATCRAFEGADVAILAAAVADYTPASPADHKLKKAHEHLDTVELVETADILATVSAAKGCRVVVGFAAETNDLVANATAKLSRKGCDMIVANDVSRAESTFGSDTNRVTLVTPDGSEQLELMSKDDVAHAIVSRVASLLAQGSSEGA
ncbi:MAG: bifunctional phosphopantothenoylcysteine decarboxylase/phosphopantothenate--cysteine ligase CoaBC [Atopobiaceae bacterium]|nr:bifunctional phosphopantothenoylcysteine decarboxylase/phosphopantothenate--cysteine ligase CoaBC [Atopobiaceae bacterium]